MWIWLRQSKISIFLPFFFFYFSPIFFFFLIFLLFLTQPFPASCSEVGKWLKVQRPQGHSSVWVNIQEKHEGNTTTDSFFPISIETATCSFSKPEDLTLSAVFIVPRGCSFGSASYFLSEITSIFALSNTLWQRAPPLDNTGKKITPKLVFLFVFITC